MALWAINGFSQISFITNDQKLVEDAIKDATFITRQSFQIKDKASGDLYGLNGKQEFGVEYSLGVKIPDGIVLTDKAVRPWNYNAKFSKYKGKYEPVPYLSSATEITKAPQYDSLSYEQDKAVALVDTVLYKASSNTYGGKGIALDGSAGEKSGWIVWVSTPKETDFEKEISHEYTIYKKSVNVEEDKKSAPIDVPDMEQTIIGALYVVPTFPRIGVIEFRLCGVAVPDGKGWKLCFPFLGMKDSKGEGGKQEEAKPSDGGGSELTPIDRKDDGKGKGKKKKKNK